MPRARMIIAVFLVLGAVMSFAQEKTQLTVTAKETQIRATPTYLGKVLAKLAYGTKVQVLATQGSWVKVALPTGKGEGWVNLSALKEYKGGDMKTGSSNVASSASSGEVGAAAKGFTKEIEDQYKKDKKLDYSMVDAMEKYSVPPEQVAEFLKQGGLDTSMGGGQ